MTDQITFARTDDAAFVLNGDRYGLYLDDNGRPYFKDEHGYNLNSTYFRGALNFINGDSTDEAAAAVREDIAEAQSRLGFFGKG